MNPFPRYLRRIAFSCFILLFSQFLGARIAFYGDTQSNSEIHSRIVSSMLEHEPGIAFHLGDLTVRGSTQQHYDDFFAISAPLSQICKLWPVRGNHDRDRALFLANFPDLGGKTWYTVEHDSLLFIILDSTMDLKPRSEQYEWLRQTLETVPILPRIVLLHHPVFSSGYRPGEAELDLFLPALFKDSGVIVVVSGHHHNYERLEYDGIAYLITGGAGGELRTGHKTLPQSRMLRIVHHYLILSRDGTSLNCAAYDQDGQLVETFEIFIP